MFKRVIIGNFYATGDVDNARDESLWDLCRLFSRIDVACGLVCACLFCG